MKARAYLVVRKEKPMPPAKPPSTPPAPTGIRAPGGNGVARGGGMVCAGPIRS